MKTLLSILIVVFLVSCNSEDGTQYFTVDNSGEERTLDAVNFWSGPVYSTYNYYGTIVERYLSAPLIKAEVVIPEVFFVTEDSENSLVVGDRAYFMINNNFDTRCEYLYDGVNFVFNTCQEDLGGYDVNDVIYLEDHPHPNFGVTNENTIMLFGRLSNNLHTGLIKFNTLL